MGDATTELAGLLENAGARVTLDPERNYRNPCHFCAKPGPHGLVRIGKYHERGPGNLRKGDPIERPVCEACLDSTVILVLRSLDLTLITINRFDQERAEAFAVLDASGVPGRMLAERIEQLARERDVANGRNGELADEVGALRRRLGLCPDCGFEPGTACRVHGCEQ